MIISICIYIYILNVYRMMLWIIDFFCVWGVVVIRILALGSDALILPLVLNLYKP